MNMNYLKTIVVATAVMFFAGISVCAAQTPDVRHVTGEITWIDLKLGQLQLEKDVSPRTGEITEYRINKDETRVTDPTDKKFLTVADLQPGQHVIIDVIYGKEESIVKKITADPKPTPNLQEAYGRIEAIDVTAGTLTLATRQMVGDAEMSNLSYFVFEPKDIVVMRSPSSEPVQLSLKPGDVVKVQYAEKDGKQQIHSITLYSPKVTSITTTTTTTTTQ